MSDSEGLGGGVTCNKFESENRVNLTPRLRKQLPASGSFVFLFQLPMSPRSPVLGRRSG